MAIVLLLVSNLALSAATVTVFAAASLTDALNQIASDYQKQGGDRVVFSFAGSSVLARQIEEGAPADLFFSADDRWMDELEKKGLIVSASRRSRLSNALVVVVPADSASPVTSVEDLKRVSRLALADPASVPAGIYAREYLERKHLWAALEKRIIPTANVRAALAAVASGDADAGIVYKTDAAISRKVKVACEIAATEGPKIDYPAALVKNADHAAGARRFLDFLESPGAARVFERFGFIVRDRTP